MTYDKKINWLLRVGVAFAFIYPAISAIFNPFSWIGYFPSFFLDLPINDLVLLHIFGATEVILALWILCGKNSKLPSGIAALYLAAIIVFNFSQMDVIFRDIPILLMTLALMLDKPHIQTDTPSRE